MYQTTVWKGRVEIDKQQEVRIFLMTWTIHCGIATPAQPKLNTIREDVVASRSIAVRDSGMFNCNAIHSLFLQNVR